jgi:pantoate--beta-alanine ligase
MIIASSVAHMNELSQHLRNQGKSIGFVPTMGALHQGHLKLAEMSIHENDVTICSIFVNPIQFNNPADLEKYPRTFEADARMLEAIGCDIIFAPTVDEMYPEAVKKVFEFGELDKVMEGRFRPGHFNGVAVVVEKLFEITIPHKAYFGEKDFQQLAIVKAMVRMQNLPVEIISHPTVREHDGLAMSSRNQRLTDTQRKLAPIIYQTLKKAALMSQSQADIEAVKAYVDNVINDNAEMELEYFEISDPENLKPVITYTPGRKVVACIAVFMGPVRLIDNLVYNL